MLLRKWELQPALSLPPGFSSSKWLYQAQVLRRSQTLTSFLTCPPGAAWKQEKSCPGDICVSKCHRANSEELGEITPGVLFLGDGSSRINRGGSPPADCPRRQAGTAAGRRNSHWARTGCSVGPLSALQ